MEAAQEEIPAASSKEWSQIIFDMTSEIQEALRKGCLPNPGSRREILDMGTDICTSIRKGLGRVDQLLSALPSQPSRTANLNIDPLPGMEELAGQVTAPIAESGADDFVMPIRRGRGRPRKQV